MRILIIEDEHYASKRLQVLIKKELPDANILEIIDTVEESIDWLSKHVEPNLIFMDIQLADGLSFQIFESIKVKSPIVFTTAYYEYAINAFKVNSIDYLLKPIDEEAFRKAINKYQEFYPKYNTKINWNEITKELVQSKEQYKSRFLVKTGNSYSYLNCKDIKIILSEEGLSFAYDQKGNRFILDHSLDKLESILDPKKCFRISRKFIINLEAIKKIHPYFNNRMKVDVDLKIDENLIVSREKVKDFKMWLDS